MLKRQEKPETKIDKYRYGEEMVTPTDGYLCLEDWVNSVLLYCNKETDVVQTTVCPLPLPWLEPVLGRETLCVWKRPCHRNAGQH